MCPREAPGLLGLKGSRVYEGLGFGLGFRVWGVYEGLPEATTADFCVGSYCKPYYGVSRDPTRKVGFGRLR